MVGWLIAQWRCDKSNPLHTPITWIVLVGLGGGEFRLDRVFERLGVALDMRDAFRWG